jgi:hypothetical protein
MKLIHTVASILAVLVIGISGIYLFSQRQVKEVQQELPQEVPAPKLSFTSKNLENFRNTYAVESNQIVQNTEVGIETGRANAAPVQGVTIPTAPKTNQTVTVSKPQSVKTNVTQPQVNSNVPVQTINTNPDFTKTNVECTYNTLANKNFAPQVLRSNDPEGFVVFKDPGSGISIQGDEYSITRTGPGYLQVTLYSEGDEEASGRVVLQKISDVCKSKMISQVSPNQYAKWISDIDLQNYGDTEERLSRVESDAEQFAQVLYNTGVLGFTYKLTADSYMNGTQNFSMFGDLAEVRTDKGQYVYAYYTFANSEYYGSTAFFLPESFFEGVNMNQELYKKLIRTFTHEIIF